MTRLPDRAPRRVLVPHAPVLVAGFREVLWLHPDGEIEALAPADARSRVERETPMLCHGPATARRLDMPGFPALDLLELFAFVHPARFCVPTPRGLAEALGLPAPASSPEACVTLATVARALLEKLAEEIDPEVRAIAEVMDRGGWLWGPAVLAALPAAEAGELRKTAGLRVWIGLDEWSEPAPAPPPGNEPVWPEEARSRLAELALRRRSGVLRIGRENLLCLPNHEDALGAAMGRPGRPAGHLGLIARWITASESGDLVAGDFPGWLAELIGRGRVGWLADRRGECIHSACPHFRRCFVEKNIRQARQARIVVANHALVMAQAALGGLEDATVPTRYVFDEGHHLLDAADNAFSVRLSGQEGRELRRWIVGAEAGGRSRARGLRRRIGDLVEGDDDGAKALLDVLAAARILPGNGWAQRVAEARGHQGFERFLVLVRQQVLARAVLADSGYGLQAEARPPIEGLVEAALSLAESLGRLAAALKHLSARLRTRLEDPDDPPDPGLRQRLDATMRSLQ